MRKISFPASQHQETTAAMRDEYNGINFLTVLEVCGQGINLNTIKNPNYCYIEERG